MEKSSGSKVFGLLKQHPFAAAIAAMLAPVHTAGGLLAATAGEKAIKKMITKFPKSPAMAKKLWADHKGKAGIAALLGLGGLGLAKSNSSAPPAKSISINIDRTNPGGLSQLIQDNPMLTLLGGGLSGYALNSMLNKDDEDE